MDDVLETMIGASLLFGSNSSKTPRRYDPEFLREVEATEKWVKQNRNPRKEEQIFLLLKTKEGQDYIRKELHEAVLEYNDGVQFEFTAPLSESDILNEKKWALTWMLAKQGHVPLWQGESIITITKIHDLAYAGGQLALLKAAGCEASVLQRAINNSMRPYAIDMSEDYDARKAVARKNREKREFANLRNTANKSEEVKDSWFSIHIDDKLESALLQEIASEQEPLAPIITKYFGIWDKLKIAHYYPKTWRKSEREFYIRWIALWEMAAKGKVPSWQNGWVPKYRSDYLCFKEQIRILSMNGHDPSPLVLQLPSRSPQNNRTLEEIVFCK